MTDSMYNQLKTVLDSILARLDELEKQLDALTKKALVINDKQGS